MTSPKPDDPGQNGDADSDSSEGKEGRLSLSRYPTQTEGESGQGLSFVETRERADEITPLSSLGSGSPFGPNGSLLSGYGQSGPTPASFMSSVNSSASNQSWSQTGQSRSRGGSGNTSVNGTHEPSTASMYVNTNNSKPQRPTMSTRTPSSAYAPPRRPSQYALATNRHRSSSSSRSGKPNPDADYRAQKKAYVQRLEHDNADDNTLNPDEFTSSLGYSTDTDVEEESPSANDYVENDPYDQETLLYYGNDDMQPSEEELKIPANRERLEWHSMLANVLTGDVVRQEKKRLIGSGEKQGDNSLRTEVWMGIRAKVCGRTLAAQKRVIEEQRSKITSQIDDIVSFEIRGEAEVGKTPKEQVEGVVHKIEKIESLYPTIGALEQAHPRAGSEAFREITSALIAWHNTTALINTQLGILQAWVGNEELDFTKSRKRADDGEANLGEESSFIDRILKEDGLKSLQGESSLLVAVEKVINKAKNTLIENASTFADKHLPPYIEELLTLINFPSRLVQEIIRVRLSYASKIKDPASQGVMIAEQMMTQFQILLNLAVKIKESYMIISQAEPGWDLPPCLDENFDHVVLDALRFYFKMLNWKLSANKSIFREAEILEQEWGFANDLGRYFEGGDIEVAEQFSSLTSKALHRLTSHFEKELQRRPNEVAGPEMDRRYKSILDSVRVRQRKLFRFSRLLTQTFENAAEYGVSKNRNSLQEVYDNLMLSGHLLVNTLSGTESKLTIIASPTLQDRPRDIQSLLGTSYRAEEVPEDPSNPYILVLHPEEDLYWDGLRQDVQIKTPTLDVKPGKLRLVAEGPEQLLQNAKISFMQAISMQLDIVVPQRANLPNVDKELQRIKKTAYKLSNTIMDSVEIIRKQLHGLDCQELIQTCFAFATEFGQRSVLYMDHNRRALNNLRLTRLALDWIAFICDDCIASERKTFRWAVVALEFAMIMTRGQNILTISEEEYSKLRSKVAGCMSLLISHFDIMGARSNVAAQAEKQRMYDSMGGKFKLDISKLKDDEESAALVREQWMEQLATIEDFRKQREIERQALGRVLEDSNEADRYLTYLSSSATNLSLRWQLGQFIGGGTFGSVYSALNLDSNYLMAVKEIRLQDPQLIPSIVSQIRDEMGVLQILDHPNVVSYYGIEVHRDKVYIFMEYCQGGSLAGLLEHGRIEDETVITVYALQLLEGLAYLHESGVVHRDIKPENILLDHNGVIKYVDFGAAKIIAKRGGKTVAAAENPSRQGRQKSMTGTPMYMSPEVIRGTNNLGGNSSNQPGRPGAVDTWSLGCVILEMATGRRPWASLDNEWAIMYNIAQGNTPQMPSKDQLSEQGIDFLKKCFERDPVRRASAAELLQHEWVMQLRNQLNLEPATPTSSNEASSSGGGSGQNSALSTRNSYAVQSNSASSG